MVKVENEYGDRYTGKCSNAIYQGHYGNTIRRKGYKENKPPSKKQLQTRQRFIEATEKIKSLTYEQIQYIKTVYRILKEKNPRQWPVNWFNFAKKLHIKIPEFQIIDIYTNEYKIKYFNIYQVIETNPYGTILFDSGILSSPDAGTYHNTFQKIPDPNTALIEITILPGIKHNFIISEIEIGSKFFDIRFFDNRYFT